MTAPSRSRTRTSSLAPDAGEATDPRRRLGDAGEELTAQWYAEQGYEVVARNWRCRNGELDLVAWRGGELVFCEVKTRSSRRFGHPLEAVDARKQHRIRGLALAFIAATGARGRMRFDVAAVENGRVEVYPGVF